MARGTTDNQGNNLVTAKLMSTKFPLTAVLAEITEVCRQAQSEIHLTWQPREMNVEADDLTNLKFDGFTSSNRVACELQSIKWLVLDDFLKAAQEIYSRTTKGATALGTTVETKEKAGTWRKTKAAERLKVRDPW